MLWDIPSLICLMTKKKELTLELRGELAARLSNGKHEAFLRKVKETIRLLFSSEIYEEIAQEEEKKVRDKLARNTAAQDQCQQKS